MADEFISPRKQKELEAEAERAAKQARYEKFNQWCDDMLLPRAVAIEGFKAEEGLDDA